MARAYRYESPLKGARLRLADTAVANVVVSRYGLQPGSAARAARHGALGAALHTLLLRCAPAASHIVPISHEHPKPDKRSAAYGGGRKAPVAAPAAVSVGFAGPPTVLVAECVEQLYMAGEEESSRLLSLLAMPFTLQVRLMGAARHSKM